MLRSAPQGLRDAAGPQTQTDREPPLAAARGPVHAAVTRLMLTDFRCYATARLTVEARPVVLTGPNGAGKTNLLEAISFLSPGRGLRRARLGEVDRRPPPAPATAPPGDGATAGDAAAVIGVAGGNGRAWALSATVATPRGPVQIGTGREPGEGSERRTVRIDGAAARSQAALAEHVNLVWLTPQMDRLFQEGSSARRRFLDRLVYGFDPAHASRLAAYEQAMRERGRLLRDGPQDALWLAALEARMAEAGSAIAAARRDVTEALDQACATGIGPFPQARLALRGLIEDWLATMPALAAEEAFRGRLAAARRVDAESGTTTAGPHRSDLAVHLVTSGRPAEQCSTGEQKALLIAVLLAHARLQAARRGAAPLMLLDEVAAHLDAERRDALFAEILALGTQAWLTGTDAVLFQGMRGAGQFFTVAEAALTPA